MIILFYSISSLVLALIACRIWFASPSLAGRAQSAVFCDTGNTPLARAFAAHKSKHGGMTGVFPLSRGHEAFAARRRLARLAARSIDVQYYIWRDDLTGGLLLGELLAAADRGVRVRMLIDDNMTTGLDTMLAAANTHPNLEIRLFNPFILRKVRLLNLFFDFRRLNRRMHNKSFTVDNQATIVGGRNIGDEYFNANQGTQFADMDVLLAGSIVEEVSRDFDRYWNSDSAYPAERILSFAGEEDRAILQDKLMRVVTSEIGLHFDELSTDTPIATLQFESDDAFEWVNATFYSDAPAKGLGEIPRKKLLVTGLAQALSEAKVSLDVATAYFVPGKFGVSYLSHICKNRVVVRVLTNSLASNNVVPVHAGYARYRKKLLRAGVRIFELKPSVVTTVPASSGRRAKLLERFGASSSSLHAKMFTIDVARVFIGSFNFDPRSLYLNCEMGILIESSKLANDITLQMDALVQNRSYAPHLQNGHRLRWSDMALATDAPLLDREPESRLKQRLLVWFVSLLPVEWLL
jgi:cardiolipin synthase C